MHRASGRLNLVVSNSDVNMDDSWTTCHSPFFDFYLRMLH